MVSSNGLVSVDAQPIWYSKIVLGASSDENRSVEWVYTGTAPGRQRPSCVGRHDNSRLSLIDRRRLMVVLA